MPPRGFDIPENYEVDQGFGTWNDGSFKVVDSGFTPTHYIPGPGPWDAPDFDGVVRGSVKVNRGMVDEQSAVILGKIRRIICGGLHIGGFKNFDFLRNLESIEDFFSCASDDTLECINGLADVKIGGLVYFYGTPFEKIENAEDIPKYARGG